MITEDEEEDKYEKMKLSCIELKKTRRKREKDYWMNTKMCRQIN